MLVHEIVRAQQNSRLRRLRQRCRYDFNVDNLSEVRFVELFRVNKALFNELVRLLTNHLHVPVHRDKVTIPQKILIALRFYAVGSYQRCIEGGFNLAVSQTSAHRYIHEVTEAIYEHLSAIYIKFPTALREMNQNKETFMNKFNMPGVIGAIDCTHIAILEPHHEEHNFINRKGFHSLNTQIICDANLKILAVNSNFPGATHDSFIWRQSQIRDFLLNEYNFNNLRGTWLIGDSGYPLEPFLMTPFANPLPGTPEARFNTAHSCARNTVERTIGLLKGRFRCLLKESVARYESRFVAKLITACCVLHNMCRIDFNIIMNNDENQEDNVPVIIPYNAFADMRLLMKVGL